MLIILLFPKSIFAFVDFIYKVYAQINIFIYIQFFGYKANNKKSRTAIIYFQK